MLASLALAALLSATPGDGGRTLWLVQPLYPGQDALQGRTEEAVRALITKDDRPTQVVGVQELTQWLKLHGTHTGALSCLTESGPCPEPLSSMVQNLGFSRVLLVRGGQDEAGYRVKLASFRPAEGGASTVTEGVSATLDKALLGAVVKVEQLTASMGVTSDPPGATVFVDGEKLGVTPLTTQVLPGERQIKLVLPGYQTLELTQSVPVRGTVQVDHALEKVPARLIARVLPPGTAVVVDDHEVGQDAVDTGIQPGLHTLRATKGGYQPYEVKADIKPGDTYRLEQTLQPTGWESFKMGVNASQEDIYSRHSYFDISFDDFNQNGDHNSGMRFGNGTDANARTAELLAPGSNAGVRGVSIEYGTFGRYFGLDLFNLGYTKNYQPWTLSVQNATPGASTINARGDFLNLKLAQPQVRYVFWRLQFMLTVGLELRAGWLQETATPQVYNNGFAELDLLISGRLAVRAFIVAGFYLQAGYQYSFTLVGTKTQTNDFSSSLRGWTFGAGYAF